MKNNLTKLVWATGIALLGIICLQGYWIYHSYLDKKESLKSEVSAAMLSIRLANIVRKQDAKLSSIDTSTSQTDADSILNEGENAILSRSLMKKTNGIADILTQNPLFNKRQQTPVSNWLTLSDSANSITDLSLKRYKHALSLSLKIKNIHFPIEVALINSQNKIVKCTINPNKFSAIKLKTALPNPMAFQLKNEGRVKFQVAIPHAFGFLVKKVLLLAIISTLLVAFCIGSLTYMVSVFYKQKKLTVIRNDFTNNMTHELKTPISSVTVALGLLKEEYTLLSKKERGEYFQIAENELQRLTLLVNKVLKMAAYEKGEIDLHLQYFSVQSWIDSIVTPLKPVLTRTDGRMSVTVYPEQLKMRADRANMSSVLQNLVDNAIKYADKEKKEGLIIQVEAWQNEENYYLVVQDNGIGIQFNHQERIFDKFFRVPTGDEHETKGYGLGLSYVKEIIELHGGAIEVESKFHTGTRFKIIIPKKNHNHNV